MRDLAFLRVFSLNSQCGLPDQLFDVQGSRGTRLNLKVLANNTCFISKLVFIFASSELDNHNNNCIHHRNWHNNSWHFYLHICPHLETKHWGIVVSEELHMCICVIVHMCIYWFLASLEHQHYPPRWHKSGICAHWLIYIIIVSQQPQMIDQVQVRGIKKI